jgi:hypothetical protein
VQQDLHRLPFIQDGDGIPVRNTHDPAGEIPSQSGMHQQEKSEKPSARTDAHRPNDCQSQHLRTNHPLTLLCVCGVSESLLDAI